MLTGEYRNTLDEKGRLMIPARLRAEIAGNELVLTRGVDTCLWLFPPNEWQRISDNLMSATSPFHKTARLIQRRIVAPAQTVEIDKSGRISIPQGLREDSGMKKGVVLLGIKKYIEIWDEEAYQAYWKENESTFQQAAEELGELVSF
jgi:MraZ protein